MSNNIFSWKRFALLWKQHFIQNGQLLMLSTVAYVGVIFIVLSVAQLASDLEPHNLGSFQVFLVGFVTVFGVLWVGHSFPAFRGKESTISYLMVPASVPEKFLFELASRIGLMILVLPILYWTTFHVQGYLFTMFTEKSFDAVGVQYLLKIDVQPEDAPYVYTITTAGSVLALVLVFAGSAMFTKQPLVKSLFSVAVVILFYVLYTYVVLSHLGLEEYNPPEAMILLPDDEAVAFKLVSAGLIGTIAVMLFVAYRKLKEREV